MCITPRCALNGPFFTIEQWNTRATDRELSDLRDKLGAACDVIEAARMALNANDNTREGSEAYNRGHCAIRCFKGQNPELFRAKSERPEPEDK